MNWLTPAPFSSPQTNNIPYYLSQANHSFVSVARNSAWHTRAQSLELSSHTASSPNMPLGTARAIQHDINYSSSRHLLQFPGIQRSSRNLFQKVGLQDILQETAYSGCIGGHFQYFFPVTQLDCCFQNSQNRHGSAEKCASPGVQPFREARTAIDLSSRGHGSPRGQMGASRAASKARHASRVDTRRPARVPT